MSLLFYDFHFRRYTVRRYYLCLNIDAFYSAYGKKGTHPQEKAHHISAQALTYWQSRLTIEMPIGTARSAYAQVRNGHHHTESCEGEMDE